MEADRKEFRGSSQEDVDGQFGEYLELAQDRVRVFSVEYTEPLDGSGEWKLTFQYVSIPRDDPCA
ncbi:MAG: hypothetical protein HY980_01955 [Candidatus Magasanikbacteria bacterium]|nr:hypothetical protein [Candidatus Magasanikbacteria bacterium]